MVDSDPLYHPVPNNTTDSTTNQYDSSDYSGLQVREDEQHPDYSGLQVREDDKNMPKGVGSASDSRSWQPGMADGSQHGDFQVRDRGENASDVLELMPKSPTQTRSWSRTNHAPPQGNSRKARLLDWLGGGKGVIITGVLVLVVLVIAIVGALVGSKKGRVRGKTGAVPPGSTHLGCYFDDTARALRDDRHVDASMTPSLCLSLCPNVPFYAVEAGTECYCGKDIHDGYPRVEDRDCDSPCGGDPNSKCGGFWRLDLYTPKGEKGPPAVNYTSRGCFVDKPNRGLQSLFRDDSRMTPKLCAGFCANYKFAGVEDGTQCFCGNAWPSDYPKVVDKDCNYTCGGDPGFSCGAIWRLNLYAIGL